MKDRDLIKFAKEFRKGILGTNRGNSEGWCAAICWPLEALLSLHGIEAVAVETDLSSNGRSEAMNHVWLRLPDGRALDPTADQFDQSLGEVYLGSPLWFHAAGVTGE